MKIGLGGVDVSKISVKKKGATESKCAEKMQNLEITPLHLRRDGTISDLKLDTKSYIEFTYFPHVTGVDFVSIYIS